jgi:2-polyprenyl-3-methyl-5-hydroxy-6-metoxy-1,4-benzoquinol methylase
MKDNWTDESFAASWDGRHVAGNPSRPFVLSVIQAILQSLAAQRTALSVLEIGSGSGLVTERILDAVPTATVDGVDFSEPMMARAATRLARHGARFRQHRADLAAFETGALAAGQYDVVLVLQVLHEIPPSAKRAVLTALRSSIATGGLLFYGERLRADYARFALPHEALWRALAHWTPETKQPEFRDRVSEVTGKTDYTTSLADELAVFAETGYRVEPLLVLGERCLLAALPRG